MPSYVKASLLHSPETMNTQLNFCNELSYIRLHSRRPSRPRAQVVSACSDSAAQNLQNMRTATDIIKQASPTPMMLVWPHANASKSLACLPAQSLALYVNEDMFHNTHRALIRRLHSSPRPISEPLGADSLCLWKSLSRVFCAARPLNNVEASPRGLIFNVCTCHCLLSLSSFHFSR